MEELIKNFKIICGNCAKINPGFPDNNTLYVDWPRQYYMFVCFNCNQTEVFDEFGRPVKLRKAEKEKRNLD